MSSVKAKRDSKEENIFYQSFTLLYQNSQHAIFTYFSPEFHIYSQLLITYFY